ncbi:capsule assembly Wzi family protein [Mucilaginibacter pocheonensis]|uniref:Capsule assembly protein Wzi n=1 Tax=Mucilaginibacter pocheonensis TaxID=398050 RepID=A0ABU1T6N1_9SPHI|nr:capsule assembly Wzi family protein [Mucilaginibacter pocheonensis]MDR6940561.1 hypothetical protein [Mucilaginibacter pocheonensis]
MRRLLLFTTITFFYTVAKAQTNTFHINLEAQGIATSSNAVPFWLRSNQFGSVPLKGGSGSLIGQISKDYDTTRRTKLFDWAGSFEGRGNIGNYSKFILVEGYLKGRAGVFELKAGRSKDIVGLTDSTLSSGSFSISGNALGIPKISLGIPQYYSIPILGKLFAVKGNIATGYLGNIDIDYARAKVNKSKSYYWENTFYTKIGMPDWRFKIEAGYNHEALWGDEKDILRPFNLSGSETFWYVVLGKTYTYSKVGNHLGSLDIGAEYKFDAFTVSLYRQSFYDKGGLAHLANIADGLNGLKFVNNKAGQGNFYWKKILFEILNTTNQGGYISSKPTASGAENYYNNYEYVEGWSYKGMGLGTPFVTTEADAREGLPSSPRNYFINNRVLAFHTAAEFSVFKWLYTGKLSYSINRGTYETGSGPFQGPANQIMIPTIGPFKKVHQTSVYLEGIRPLKNNYTVGYDVGFDRGGLLNNSFGLILKVSKSFL